MVQLVTRIFTFRFYNKDAVIEYLLDKSAERPNTEVAAHIRGIKVSLGWCRLIVFGIFSIVYTKEMHVL